MMLTLPFGTRNEHVELVELATPLQIAPVQLVKVKPSSAVACRTTGELKSSEDVQSVWPLRGPPPQSIGSGSALKLTTLPFELLNTLVTNCLSVKLALTLCAFPLGVNMQLEVLLTQPMKPSKLEPMAALAVRVTGLPSKKVSEHVAAVGLARLQAMPAGVEVRVPVPEPVPKTRRSVVRR